MEGKMWTFIDQAHTILGVIGNLLLIGLAIYGFVLVANVVVDSSDSNIKFFSRNVTTHLPSLYLAGTIFLGIICFKLLLN
jgi:hypothetical protein